MTLEINVSGLHMSASDQPTQDSTAYRFFHSHLGEVESGPGQIPMQAEFVSWIRLSHLPNDEGEVAGRGRQQILQR
jgi:hypothetical protein